MNAVSGLRTIVLATIAASAVGCTALRHEAMPGAAKDIDDGSRSVRTARQQDDWSTVWTAVYRNFHSAGFNGVDWRALKKTVADRIEAGLSEEEFTTLIDGTLARLEDRKSVV